MPMLEVLDVSKQFPPREAGEAPIHALAPVSFSVRKAEFVSVVGPSGCGKSTLFNIIAGLETPTTGRLRYEDQDVTDLRGRIGYQLQRDLLLPWRRILDNITLALEIRGVSRAERDQRGREVLQRYGLGGFAERYPRELSGGMRQRAALMRTLLFDRDLIMLDEPFGALDAQTRLLMQEWLLSVYQESRKTILLITHDIEEAIFLSTRVLVMSARPGCIKGEFNIDLPTPRTSEVFFDARFAEYKKQLHHMIREESMKAFESTATAQSLGAST
jgi:ABC-type nitrate/sulfonate/bicarbonate transport system ATPase subunit